MGGRPTDARRRGAATIPLVMLAALALIASMVVPPMTEAELRRQADVVVDGRVTVQRVVRLGQRVFTFSTLIVGDGQQVRSYVVALPGGDVDGVTQRVPGSPQLQLGARYRLYLGPATGPRADAHSPPARGVVGFFRGAFAIDDAHNDALVPFGDDGFPLLVPTLRSGLPVKQR